MSLITTAVVVGLIALLAIQFIPDPYAIPVLIGVIVAIIRYLHDFISDVNDALMDLEKTKAFSPLLSGLFGGLTGMIISKGKFNPDGSDKTLEQLQSAHEQAVKDENYELAETLKKQIDQYLKNGE